MSEPILVVDPGTAWTSAAVVTGSGHQLLKEPSSGSYCWPTAVALESQVLRVGTVAERRKRAEPQLYAGRLTGPRLTGGAVTLGNRRYPPADLLAALLGALRSEAERLASTPVTRILLLSPDARGPVSPHGQAMLAAAAAAGLADAELLFLPAAVTMAASARAGPPGSLVLVCDGGASALRLTLLQAGDGHAATMRSASMVTGCGGDALDALLTEAIRGARSSKWLRPLLAAGGAAGDRTRLDLAELGRRLRHELTDSDRAEDTLTPLTPVLQFSRPDLERLMRPALGQLSSACREVLTRAGSRGAGGVATPPVRLELVPAVLFAGGCARTPAIQRALSSALSRQVQPLPAPELAALRGGIEWATSAAHHRVAAVPVPVGLRELAWPVPADAARLISWNVAVGAAYPAGEPLAWVRSEDDAVWDLASDQPGILEQQCATAGTIVATDDVLAVIRRTALGPADWRRAPLRLATVPGGQLAAFSRDGRQLVTADAAGLVRIWDAETAVDLGRYQLTAPPRPGRLDAAMRPDGHWLVAFFDGTAVIVLDMTAGSQLARLAKGDDPAVIRFSADGSRLCIAEAKRVRLWDARWRELLSVKARPLSRDAAAMSRDGGWLALVSKAGLEVWEQATGKRVIARELPRFKGTVAQLAFSADATRVAFAVDSQLELIALPSGQSLWTIQVAGPVRGADFTPDDRLLVTVNHSPASSSAWFLDVATGKAAGRINAGQGECSCARYSPDGRFLVTSEDDNAVLWALA